MDHLHFLYKYLWHVNNHLMKTDIRWIFMMALVGEYDSWTVHLVLDFRTESRDTCSHNWIHMEWPLTLDPPQWEYLYPRRSFNFSHEILLQGKETKSSLRNPALTKEHRCFYYDQRSGFNKLLETEVSRPRPKIPKRLIGEGVLVIRVVFCCC